MSMVMPENFQHILRVMNTNIAGERNIIYAMTAIKGCGRRFSTVCLKKAEIDVRKRAGEMVSLFFSFLLLPCLAVPVQRPMSMRKSKRHCLFILLFLRLSSLRMMSARLSPSCRTPASTRFRITC